MAEMFKQFEKEKQAMKDSFLQASSELRRTAQTAAASEAEVRLARFAYAHLVCVCVCVCDDECSV